jgi:hypothetical protein
MVVAQEARAVATVGLLMGKNLTARNASSLMVTLGTSIPVLDSSGT